MYWSEVSARVLGRLSDTRTACEVSTSRWLISASADQESCSSLRKLSTRLNGGPARSPAVEDTVFMHGRNQSDEGPKRADPSDATFLSVLEYCSHAPTTTRPDHDPVAQKCPRRAKAHCSPAGPYYGHYAEGTACATGKSHRLEPPGDWKPFVWSAFIGSDLDRGIVSQDSECRSPPYCLARYNASTGSNAVIGASSCAIAVSSR